MNPLDIARTILTIFAQSSLHAKQIESLTHSVIGVLNAGPVGVASVGRAHAAARGVAPKHAIKQFDRFLSNGKINLETAQGDVLRFVLGKRAEITVALDWTDYADGNHHRIAINLITDHGRATPLVWKTVTAEELTKRRNEHEDELLRTLKRLLPESVKQVTVLADRGFGDIKLYDMLKAELEFDFIIRFRGCIKVRDETGERRFAKDWVPSNGSALRLPHAKLTSEEFEVGAVVAVKAAGMKEPWLLATSLDKSADETAEEYGRRFTIEENFRDEKDWHFGLGSLYVGIERTDRRDKMCLVITIALIIFTLLGHAGEELGLDRVLRANTAKKRTHSLPRQGREYFRGAMGKVVDAAQRLLGMFWDILENQRSWTARTGLI